MDKHSNPDPHPIDYRFSLANERTFLAWVRTSLALIAAGVAAAKAIEFHHDVWRWVVSLPPMLAGAVLAASAAARWRSYENAMVAGRRLPVGRTARAVGFGLGLYGALVVIAVILDG